MGKRERDNVHSVPTTRCKTRREATIQHDCIHSLGYEEVSSSTNVSQLKGLFQEEGKIFLSPSLDIQLKLASYIQMYCTCTCMMGLARCGLLRVAGLPVEGMSAAGEVLRVRGGG